MELDVAAAFPTPIGRFRVPDSDAMNRDLHALILAEEAEYSSLGRSNIGGVALSSRLSAPAGPRGVRSDCVANLDLAPDD